MLATFGSIHSRPTYGNHVAVRKFKCATVHVQTYSDGVQVRAVRNTVGEHYSNGSIAFRKY